MLTRFSSLLYGIIVTMALSGCLTTSGVSNTQATVDDLKNLNASFASTQFQVNNTVESLEGLSDLRGSELLVQYKIFKNNLRLTKQNYKTIVHKTRSFKKQRTAYLARWDERSGNIIDPELRRISRERRDVIAEELSALDAEGENASQNFAPFLVNMDEISKYLDLDLSPGGVNEIEYLIANIRKNTKEINTYITNYLLGLQKIHTQMNLK